MIDKYTKHFILLIVFIGLLAGISIVNTEKTQHKELILKAVLSNNIEVTRFLLDDGADINVKYKHNHTLLHSAALYGDMKMVMLLVNNGAKLIKNDFELTAIDSAEKNSEVKAYLVKNYDKLDKVVR